MNTLQNTAQLHWAEDEANLLADFALDLFEQDGHDKYHQWLMRERDHFFHRVFEQDIELMTKFCDLFNKLTAQKTNLYI